MATQLAAEDQKVVCTECELTKIEKFKSAIANAVIRPIGVKINPDFWKLLEKEGLIQMKQVAILGFCFRSSSPFYDEDIWLIYSPELSITCEDFELPPSSKL